MHLSILAHNAAGTQYFREAESTAERFNTLKTRAFLVSFYPKKGDKKMTIKRQILGAVLLMLIWTITISAQIGNIESLNLVQEENGRGGTGDWVIMPLDQALNREIEGFPSKPSININGTIKFFINVTDGSPTFDIDIYRMGWYGGYGGRLMGSFTDLESINQGALPNSDVNTGLIECNWTMPTSGDYEWTHNNRAGPSGAYIAKLTASSGKQSYIHFIVRDDERVSDFIYSEAVTTWQAYNFWPGPQTDPAKAGKSLYHELSFGNAIPLGNANGRQARMVSFNRPYLPDNNSVYYTAGYFFIIGDYQMVRWMEKEGYDVSYTTNVDIDAATDMVNGPLSPGRHKVFLSVAHDEYWSWNMRNNLEQARNRTSQPLNIGWFGANNVHWQIRFLNADRRVIVGYKHLANSLNAAWKDPVFNHLGSPENYLTTGLWRDNESFCIGCSNPLPSEYKLPEDELVGVMTTTPNTVTGRGNFEFYEGTSRPFPSWITAGVEIGTIGHLVGYEADEIFNSPYNDPVTGDRYFWQLGSSTLYNTDVPAPYPSTPSHAVFYKLKGTGERARVFAAGTISWAWGLDPWGEPDGGGPPMIFHGPTYDERVEIMTRNILACLRDGGVCDNPPTL